MQTEDARKNTAPMDALAEHHAHPLEQLRPELSGLNTRLYIHQGVPEREQMLLMRTPVVSVILRPEPGTQPAVASLQGIFKISPARRTRYTATTDK